MSKGLEKLARIKGHFNPKDIANKELFEEDFNTIEKELKALEIIKEIMIVKEHEGYVEFICEYSIPKKNKKKIDLLKEVLL